MSSVWSVRSSNSSPCSSMSSGFVDCVVMRGRSCDLRHGQPFLTMRTTHNTNPITTSSKVTIDNIITREGCVGLFGVDLTLVFPNKENYKPLVRELIYVQLNSKWTSARLQITVDHRPLKFRF